MDIVADGYRERVVREYLTGPPPQFIDDAAMSALAARLGTTDTDDDTWSENVLTMSEADHDALDAVADDGDDDCM